MGDVEVGMKDGQKVFHKVRSSEDSDFKWLETASGSWKHDVEGHNDSTELLEEMTSLGITPSKEFLSALDSKLQEELEFQRKCAEEKEAEKTRLLTSFPFLVSAIKGLPENERAEIARNKIELIKIFNLFG